MAALLGPPPMSALRPKCVAWRLSHRTKLMSTGLLQDMGEGLICPTGAPSKPHLNSRMPMTGALAWEIFVLAGFGWDHHYAPVFDATLGNDLIGEMLNLGTGAAQRSHLH